MFPIERYILSQFPGIGYWTWNLGEGGEGFGIEMRGNFRLEFYAWTMAAGKDGEMWKREMKTKGGEVIRMREEVKVWESEGEGRKKRGQILKFEFERKFPVSCFLKMSNFLLGCKVYTPPSGRKIFRVIFSCSFRIKFYFPLFTCCENSKSRYNWKI